MNLTKPEINEAIKIVKIKYSNTPLYFKLISSLKEASEEPGVQVSNEELEILLDNIGIPMEDESEACKGLRLKVQSFLGKLRHVD